MFYLRCTFRFIRTTSLWSTSVGLPCCTLKTTNTLYISIGLIWTPTLILWSDFVKRKRKVGYKYPKTTLIYLFKFILGAAHADDLPYLFNTILMPPPEKNSLEYELIQKLTSLWTNFAKCANPTPLLPNKEIGIIWEPTAVDSFNYLHMKNDCFKLLQDPDKEFVDFWVKLYRENQVILSKLWYFLKINFFLRLCAVILFLLVCKYPV